MLKSSHKRYMFLFFLRNCAWQLAAPSRFYGGCSEQTLRCSTKPEKHHRHPRVPHISSCRHLHICELNTITSVGYFWLRCNGEWKVRCACRIIISCIPLKQTACVSTQQGVHYLYLTFIEMVCLGVETQVPDHSKKSRWRPNAQFRQNINCERNKY